MPATALIGSRLRERRLAAGLRQADVAAAAGISPSYLNLIEHNRRRVSGPVLAQLAAALGVEAAQLAGGAGSDLADDLRAAAAGVAGTGAAAELERLEEFAGRYPGWARVTAALQVRVGLLERAVETLNDRMTHDPHLSAALHEVLSALTGVRATAQILAETGDLDEGLRQRFHRNLHKDSERLAGGAEALVAYLDGSEVQRGQGIASPQEEVEGWLQGQGWALAALEDGDAAALEGQVQGLASSAARVLARAWADRARADAQALPLAAFRRALAQSAGAADAVPDPGQLAAAFGTDVIRVLRRIAFLPGSEAGFVACDASGTLLMRKPAPGFPLPRFGAACALWPVYAALARPGVPVRQRVVTPGPSGQAFLVLAYCQTSLPRGFAGPELREAAMLILQGPAGPGVAAGAAEAALPIGSSCRICPRVGCPARREPSITDEGM